MRIKVLATQVFVMFSPMKQFVWNFETKYLFIEVDVRNISITCIYIYSNKMKLLRNTFC